MPRLAQNWVLDFATTWEWTWTIDLTTTWDQLGYTKSDTLQAIPCHLIYTFKILLKSSGSQYGRSTRPIPLNFVERKVLMHKNAIDQMWAYCDIPEGVKIRLKDGKRGNSFLSKSTHWIMPFLFSFFF